MSAVQSDLNIREGDVAFWNRLRTGLIARENAKSDAVTRDMIQAGRQINKFNFLARGWDDPDRAATRDIEGYAELEDVFENDRYEEFRRDVMRRAFAMQGRPIDYRYEHPDVDWVNNMLQLRFSEDDSEQEVESDAISIARKVLYKEMMEIINEKYQDPEHGLHAIAWREFDEEQDRKRALIHDIYVDPVTLQWEANKRVHSDEELEQERVEFDKARYRIYRAEVMELRDKFRTDESSKISSYDMKRGSMWVSFGRDLPKALRLIAEAQQGVPSVAKRRKIT